MKEVTYYLIYSLIGIFSLAVILGVVLHILLQLVGIIAYFSYSGLLYFESFLKPITKLELFIPEKGINRLIMDLCATMLTGIAISGIIAFIKRPNEYFIYDLPKTIPIFYAIIGICCIIVIYYLGNRSKPENYEKEEWFDKIKKLNLPKFLKFWE